MTNWEIANKRMNAGTGAFRAGGQRCIDLAACDKAAIDAGVYEHELEGEHWSWCEYNQAMASAILDGAGIQELP